MFIEDILRSKLLDSIEEIMTEVEEEIQFVNLGSNKWQIQINVDLEKANLSSIQKELLSAILTHI
jgi:hypothetical protein